MTKTDSVRQLHRAADSLSRACAMQTIRQFYNDTAKEPIPDDLKRLLDRLD